MGIHFRVGKSHAEIDFRVGNAPWESTLGLGIPVGIHFRVGKSHAETDFRAGFSYAEHDFRVGHPL